MGNLELFKPPQEIRELNLLQELEKNPVISQRELSHKFGIALGVTNACMKRMVRRGWIRIREINRKKVGYYITQKGLSEKTNLTIRFLSYIFKHYTELKSIFEHKFLEMERRGIRRVVFYGVSDEMEIAYITIQGTNIELVGIVEDKENWRPTKIFGYELKKLDEIMEMAPDAVFITSFRETIEPELEWLKYLIGPKKIFFYYLLDVRRLIHSMK
jgi:DNA-binding Lrp family transcriptional regulator